MIVEGDNFCCHQLYKSIFDYNSCYKKTGGINSVKVIVLLLIFLWCAHSRKTAVMASSELTIEKLIRLKALIQKGRDDKMYAKPITVASYEELLPWYFSTNANMLTIRRLNKVHSKHMIKKAVDKKMFGLLQHLDQPLSTTLSPYSEEDGLSEIKANVNSFIDRLKSDLDSAQERVDSIVADHYDIPRSSKSVWPSKTVSDADTTTDSQEQASDSQKQASENQKRRDTLSADKKAVVDRYLPLVKSKDYRGKEKTTAYPQDDGDLAEHLGKVPKGQEFCLAGSFDHCSDGKKGKALNWKSVKRLHVGSLGDLRNLPENHPLEEIVYSPFHYDNGSCTCDVPPVDTRQWMWQKPVKLVMFYDDDGGELEELLLPSIESDFSLVMRSLTGYADELSQPDELADKSDIDICRHMTDIMSINHPVPPITPYVHDKRRLFGGQNGSEEEEEEEEEEDEDEDEPDKDKNEGGEEEEDKKEDEAGEDKDNGEEDKSENFIADVKGKVDKGKSKETASSGLGVLGSVAAALSEAVASAQQQQEQSEPKVGVDYTTEIHIPDDVRISSVEVYIYGGVNHPRSKLMALIQAKLMSVMKFGNRDMSTVKFSII